jgi:hypothetical protein
MYLYSLPQSATREEKPKMRAPTLFLYDPEKVYLRHQGERLQEELQEFKVNTIYRHKTVQYLLVLFSEDQLGDSYVTFSSFCVIDS